MRHMNIEPPVALPATEGSSPSTTGETDVQDDAATIARRTPRGKEAEMCVRLEAHFARLAHAGRCIWHREVRMLLPPRPGGKGVMQEGRIDYVVQLDNGLPIGIEAKAGANKTAEFGDHLRQCHDYFRGIIAPHHATPQPWVDQPLYAVFLACELPDDYRSTRQDAAYYALRLMSPFRVGFVKNHRWQGLMLVLGDEGRWWSEANGYRVDAFARRYKIGHGKRDTE